MSVTLDPINFTQRSTSMSNDPQYQCFLIQAYQCAKSRDLLMEANRAQSHSSHIERPREPRWLHGSPLAVEAAIEELMATPQEVRRKDGTTYFRKPRNDYRGLLACVSSHPATVAAICKAPAQERQRFAEWISDVDEFVTSEFGMAHVATVIHVDETFPHMHHFIVGPAAHLHPGMRAELINGRRIDDSQERIRRYKKGLTDFLNRYHARVGIKYGHKRKGNIRQQARIRDRKTWLVQKEAEQIFRELGAIDAQSRAREIYAPREGR